MFQFISLLPVLKCIVILMHNSLTWWRLIGWYSRLQKNILFPWLTLTLLLSPLVSVISHYLSIYLCASNNLIWVLLHLLILSHVIIFFLIFHLCSPDLTGGIFYIWWLYSVLKIREWKQMRIPYGKTTLTLCYDCKRQLFCNRCHMYKQVSGILYILLHLLKTAEKCYHCPNLPFLCGKCKKKSMLQCLL